MLGRREMINVKVAVSGDRCSGKTRILKLILEALNGKTGLEVSLPIYTPYGIKRFDGRGRVSEVGEESITVKGEMGESDVKE